MNRKSIQLVGDTFTHLTNGNFGYSVAGKISKNIEWTKDERDYTVYVDGWVSDAFSDGRSSRKFAWLLESNQIMPHVISDVKLNLNRYLDEFEMIFTHDQSLLALDEKFKWVPAQGFWIKEPAVYDKSKLVSMISSNKRMCAGHIERLIWVETLKDRVDLFGRGFNEIASKEDGLCDYMFSVAIENGVYETYFTEKILDCFATGTIPIYLGAPDIGKYFNQDGILSLSEFDTIDEDMYFSKMDAVEDNLRKALEMEVVEDFIYKNYLEDVF